MSYGGFLGKNALAVHFIPTVTYGSRLRNLDQRSRLGSWAGRGT